MSRQSPIATYRLQLTPSFGFADVVGVIDHVRDLGAGHVYLSPIAEAVPGSEHGYDVVDHGTVRRELGGDAGLRTLLDAAAEREMAVIVDHVPNHCSVARPELNPPWWSLLEEGPASPSAAWFDVDWPAGDGCVVVPRLGGRLDDELAAGRLRVVDGPSGSEVHYGDLRLPLRPGTETLPIADALHEQHYVLQWWRDPRRNVRRFFTIDDLVAVRVEDPAVARVVDAIPRSLLDHPAFAGVRVDHVDGLADPGAYLRSLRELLGDRLIYVEKILGRGEWLPSSWPVDGTSGYEHIVATEHVLLDPAAEEPLATSWRTVTGEHRSFEELEVEARREVLADGLRPDLERLARTAAASAHVADPRVSSIASTGTSLASVFADAAAEVIVALDRYRTYLGDDAASGDVLARAEAIAAARRPDLVGVLEVLADMVRDVDAVRDRFQQLSGPAMAKGVEDRAFYRWFPLASSCEVGGAPELWTLGVGEFHDHQRVAQERWPAGLLAGTTHDTKRSEDVRARSLALAELAEPWTGFVEGRIGDDLAAGGVDARAVVLALQTIVTAWPLDGDRLASYLVKAAREADSSTSWTEPDDAYERGLAVLAERIVAEVDDHREDHRPAGDDARKGLSGWIEVLEARGLDRSVAALALRLTSPGVPDLYQGSAGALLSLVDPDNRRPPDWDEQRRLLSVAAGIDLPAAMVDHPAAARAVVIGRLLGLRARRPDAFGRDGGYAPVGSAGASATDVLGFARCAGANAETVTVVARRSDAGSAWGDTTVHLPPGRWTDVLRDDAEPIDGDGPVSVARVLGGIPAAVLERIEGS